MVDVEAEMIFPAPRDTLWNLLALHQEEAKIREIHPAILADRVVDAGPDVVYRGLTLASYSIHERKATSKRGEWRAVWRYQRSPPESLRIEILESEGILGAGTYWENRYAEVADGTLVQTTGRLALPDVQASKRASLADAILSRIDEEDLRYLKKMGL